MLAPLESFVRDYCDKPIKQSLDAARESLELGPCESASYRLSGPLSGAVCGRHLGGLWRIAYTSDVSQRLILIIFVDSYLASGRAPNDPWDHLHLICGLINPEKDHRKLACCADDVAPAMLDDDTLERLWEDAFDSLKRKHSH